MSRALRPASIAPGPLQVISDASISMKLRTQYAADRSLKHAHIALTTTDGVVTISGTVPSEGIMLSPARARPRG